MLTCDYCGGSYTVDEIEARVDEVSSSRKKAKAQEAADLPAMLTGFYQKRPLLPKNFFYNNQVGEVPTGKKESALCFLKKMVKSTVVAAAVTGAICAVAFYL